MDFGIHMGSKGDPSLARCMDCGVWKAGGWEMSSDIL